MALGLINALDVVDKHRSVHVVRTAVEWMAVNGPRTVASTSIRMEALEDGAEVGRWTVDALAPPPIPSEVEMYRYFPLEVAIDNGLGWAIRVGEAIRSTTSAVRVVLDLFEPSIVHSQPPLPLPKKRVTKWYDPFGAKIPWSPDPPLWDDQPYHWPPPGGP